MISEATEKDWEDFWKSEDIINCYSEHVNDEDLLNTILLFKFFRPIRSLIFVKFNIGPLCFIKPSRVSSVKLSPLNFKFLCSRNITIRSV